MSELVATYEAASSLPAIALDGASLQAGWPGYERSWFRYVARRRDRPGSRLVFRERRVRSEQNFPESLLHAAWRRVGASSASITGRDGHRYRVIYPGRPADGAGPDFRDAVLLRDDGLRIHGHVEVHVRSNDWHGHGHTADSAYNGVALHVVGSENGPPIDTPSGLRIPLLVLDRDFVEQQATRVTPREPEPVSIPLPILDMGVAGDEWFKNRVHGYALELSGDPEQVLWQGALECLGYPVNKKGFRQLAARMPWSAISEIAPSSKLDDLVGVLEWAAGLGRKPCEAPALHGRAPEWRARHGRPANSPKNRVRAAAVWALRWSEFGGPVDTFVKAVRRGTTATDLNSIFLVSAEAGHLAPLGRSRAGDIVVNHLLPAVHALATAHGDVKLARHAKHLFDAYPLLSSNSLTREASLLLQARGANGKPRSAREQQGLIHIYRMAVSSQQPDRQLPLV